MITSHQQVVLDDWRSTSTLFHDSSRSNQMHILGSRHVYFVADASFSRYLLCSTMYWKHREENNSAELGISDFFNSSCSCKD